MNILLAIKNFSETIDKVILKLYNQFTKVHKAR